MFLLADDIALFYDPVIGLQNQLNILSDMTKCLDLCINLSKSNTVVFRNGDHLSHHGKWYYDGDEMKIVNAYIFYHQPDVCFI